MFLLGPVLGLLGGKIARWEIYVVGFGALVLAGWLWLRAHDAKVLAEQNARQAEVVAAQQLRDAKRATAAVQAVADAAIKRAATLAQTRLEIAHAPAPAANCAAPAAVVRALGALRRSP